MANNKYTVMELEAIKLLCNAVNKTVELPSTVIADTNVATNTTYSSYRIDAEMSALENDIQAYVDTALAGLNKLTKEVIDDKALVVKENVLYLYKDPTDMNNDYMQMMLINGVAIELGSTTCDFSSVYSKDEVDDKFALKIDLDVLTTSFNDLATSVDGKIDKDKIVTALDNTVTDEQVASALLTKTELDKTNAKLGDKADKSYVDDNFATMDKVKDGYVKLLKNTDTDADDALFISYKNRDSFGLRMYKNDNSEHELKFNTNGIYYVKNGVKVCGTSIADVDKTTITPASSNITGTIKYTVKNGICYVSLFNVKSKFNDFGIPISTTMPKPAINCGSVIVTIGTNGNIGFVYINENTTELRADFYIADVAGKCSFSYPVAE